MSQICSTDVPMQFLRRCVSPRKRAASSHRLHEIQSRQRLGAFGLSLKRFRRIGDDDRLIGILGSGEFDFVGCFAFPDSWNPTTRPDLLYF